MIDRWFHANEAGLIFAAGAAFGIFIGFLIGYGISQIKK